MTKPAQYFVLRQSIKDRANGVCEFCSLRQGEELHHRWYEVGAYTGKESAESVMWICRPCHSYVHGGILDFWIEDNSLADLGDRGFDMTPNWRRYLASR